MPQSLTPATNSPSSLELGRRLRSADDSGFFAVTARHAVPSTVLQKICYFHVTAFFKHDSPCPVLADACAVAAHRTSVFLPLGLSAFTNADLKASAPEEKSLLRFWLWCTEHSPTLYLQQS